MYVRECEENNKHLLNAIKSLRLDGKVFKAHFRKFNIIC